MIQKIKCQAVCRTLEADQYKNSSKNNPIYEISVIKISVVADRNLDSDLDSDHCESRPVDILGVHFE